MKNNTPSTPPVLLVGSVAFDIIFSLSDVFQTALHADQGVIQHINASYTAGKKKQFCGGTAGNIAYWLGKEGIRLSLFSVFGKDFFSRGYADRLEDMEVDIRGSEGEFTANAYMISDPSHQQFAVWQPNAYAQNPHQSLEDFFSSSEISEYKYAVFSPGCPASILRHMREFRKQNSSALVFFDPGQVTPFFSSDGFLECCDMADILIGNHIEHAQFQDFSFSKNLSYIITRGAEGVDTCFQGKKTHIPASTANTVIDTTGAGDAFRAGVLSVLVCGGDMEDAIVRGTELGAQCVGLASPQGDVS